MLRRNIDSFLIEWKNRPHKPLIVMGARQVGKTTSLQAFGKANYASLVYIDFKANPLYGRIFEKGYNPDSIIQEISFINPEVRFIPGDTLLLFDEVQAHPDAVTSFKMFASDGRFDVIASGSLLGVHHKQISSIPVGFKEEYQMYPIDFGEYLRNLGYDESMMERLKEHVREGKKLDPLLFDTLSSLYRDYIFVGGLPEAVDAFLKSHNYGDALAVQKRIYRDYEDDITKYCDTLSSMRVLRFYRHASRQLCLNNHKFQYSKMGHGARAHDYFGVEEWLSNAGIILLCHQLDTLEFPLSLEENPDTFRVYYVDHSLFLASLDEEARKDLILNGNLEIYNGSFYESLVASDLSRNGIPLYYYRQGESIELDFVLRIKNEIVPIEVKKSRGRAVSMNRVLSMGLPHVVHGIKLDHQNIGIANNVITMPYFLTFLIKELIEENALFQW